MKWFFEAKISSSREGKSRCACSRDGRHGSDVGVVDADVGVVDADVGVVDADVGVVDADV